MKTFDRRAFLASGAALAGAALFTGPRGHAATRLLAGAAEERVGAPCLVLVQLTGGNDGLQMVVPHADDAYHRARPSAALSRSDVLDLDGHVALAAKLTRLHARFQEGQLAIVQGVGYPAPNRSHFKSFEIWHTGRAEGRASGPGWVGRLAAARHGDDARPNRLIHVGREVPYSLHSSAHPPVAFANPRAYRLAGQEGELASPGAAPKDARDELGPGARSRLEGVRSRWRDAHASSAQVRAAVAGHRPLVDYPSDEFAGALSTAAALIAAGVGAEVISVELGGFDTHTDLRRRHGVLMERLDGGLGAFLDELDRIGAASETLVVVYSEFGRRVAENGARGTDHGTAGPVLVAGPRARGGLVGEHPSLDALVEGDLTYGTDFRAVFATVARRLFDVDSAHLFERGDWPELPLVT